MQIVQQLISTDELYSSNNAQPLLRKFSEKVQLGDFFLKMLFQRDLFISLLVCVILVLIWSTSNEGSASTSASTSTSHGQGELPNDPYMSYLFYPRLTFNGTFKADVSTVNNIPSNYDTASDVEPELSWNPHGTGEWKVDAVVTQVCYANATCVDKLGGGEPIVGEQFQNGGFKTLSKLVDLDTQAQLFSKIWGWRMRIGDFFSADFKPVPFQYIWPKVVERGSLFQFAAAYQSVLSNIKWLENTNTSPLLEEWRKIMKNNNINNDRLSIRFNVDLYERNSKKNSFTYGRITGSIGLLGMKSPPFFSHGRMLHSRSQKVQNGPFIVDKNKQKVYIDLGNSLQTTGTGSFDTGELKNLYVGTVKVSDSGTLTCDSHFLWLGKVSQTASNWYEHSAGILSLPTMGTLSENEMDIITNNALIVAEVTGSWPEIECKEIVLAEAVDGVDIHPYDDWTMHKEPEEIARVRLIATKFGKPLPDVNVKFDSNNCKEIFNESPYPIGVPAIAPPEKVLTNADGIAEFAIRTIDPKNPRNYIDGQVYPYTYRVEGQRKDFSLMCKQWKDNKSELLNHLIVVVVWDKYGPFLEPTWLDNIYPIFKQYAKLYPVMTENFVDLGNYYEVKQHRRAIQMSMELPISNPNYMPVTRDLSPAKRKVILDWLKTKDLPIGDAKHSYTVENLRKDLQTALRLEQATIPPYLTAWVSIKYDYNAEVQSILRQILIQEMSHMCLVANILNAVSGSPVFWNKNFVPRYPSRLPGGIQPDLVVPIEKVSIGLIRNVFMKIEQPAVTQERKGSFTRAFGFNLRKQCSRGSKYFNQEACFVQTPPADPSIDDEDQFSCLDPNFKSDSLANLKLREFGSFQRRRSANAIKNGSKDYEYEKHHNTIGDFYNHILNTLGYLTKCGRDNSIFNGDPRRQVNWIVRGRSYKVTDYFSAVDAIKLIVDEGEGSSPCNPMVWTKGKELSHYFLFHSIAEKHQIRVVDKAQQEKTGNVPDNVVDFSKLCNGTYYFDGPKIHLDPEGVWPMVPNPKMTKFKEGTKAYLMAEMFNEVYTKMLKSLEHVFNGYPDSLNDALGLMYSLKLHLKKLIRTPIDPDGDPDVGPNAGPTFEFTP